MISLDIFSELVKKLKQKATFVKERPVTSDSTSDTDERLVNGSGRLKKIWKSVMVLAVVVVGGISGVIIYLSMPHQPPPYNPASIKEIAPFSTTSSGDQLKVQKNDNKSLLQGKDGKIVSSAALMINPFIEISNLQKNHGTLPLPVIPGNSAVPAPDIGAIPVPAPVVPEIPAGVQPAKAVTVKGIATSKNGKGVAIMSDGSVLTEGQTYNDNRISYIGGEGIKFDDGNHMEYK